MPAGSESVGVEIAIIGGRRFRDVAINLRKAGRGDLRRNMTKNIRKAGAPALADVKRSALALPDVSPAKRRDNQSVRRLIAKACKLQVRAGRGGAYDAGVRFVVDKKALPANVVSLPHSFERPQGWRHPVFGTDRWVHQPGHPWFRRTLQRHETAFRRAVQDAVDETAAQIG